VRILILEDDPARHDIFRKNLSEIGDITITEHANTAIVLLNTEKWDALFLDHDLGGKVYCESGPGTGYEVAEWLEQHKDKMPTAVYIHTLNPSGQKKMSQALPDAKVVPFYALFPAN
jgi:CheY-like chemotaxis protein